MKPTFRDCASCGSAHLGPDCGMTFKERMKSVRVSPAAMPTRRLRNYYDGAAVAQAFGEDSREKALDDTGGYGPASHDAAGNTYYTDRHSGEKVLMTPEKVKDVYLSGPEVDPDG